MTAKLDQIKTFTVCEIAPGVWGFDLVMARGDRETVDGFSTRSHAIAAGRERAKAAAWEIHSAKKSSAGARGGGKKKQPADVKRLWANRTRELMGDGENLLSAAQAAADETGFKLQTSYRGISNQLCKIERENTPPDPRAQAERNASNMRELKRRRDDWLSTQR